MAPIDHLTPVSRDVLDPLAEAVTAVDEDARVVRIIGGPGTGKTTAARRILVAQVESGRVSPDQAVLLCASRVEAARVRALVTRDLAATTSEPLARTVASLALAILRDQAEATEQPEPYLLTGAEQDAILADLLAGHRAGEVVGPAWPGDTWPALTTDGFRAELRDLSMRVAERGLGPADLARLGRRHDQSAWVAAAAILAEYEQVLALARPGAYDPSEVVTAAADALAGDAALMRRVARRLALVVVDDAQELTASGARLITLLAGVGVRVVIIGDPDAAVQTFRGADPRLLGDTVVDALGPVVEVRLRQSLRQPSVLAQVSARVVAGVGVSGVVEHRRIAPTAGSGRAEVAVLPDSAAQISFIADTLRRAHLVDGVPWSQMAVLSRSRSRLSMLRRGLTEVPVAVQDPGQTALRDDPVAGDLLTLLAWGVAASDGERPDPDEVAGVLAGPLAGVDAASLQQVRRALAARAADEATAGPRGDLSAALLEPALLADPSLPVPEAVRRVGAAVAAGRDAVQAGADAHTALWAVWAALGVAERWRTVALRGGRSGARLDAALDVVLRLMAQAAAFDERRPGAPARDFVEAVASQRVLADSLAPQAPVTEAVELTTPAGAAGRQWRLVVIADVQDGVWPDLRLRDSLLGWQRLVDVLAGRGTGIRETVAAIRHDELRLFHVAVSRASERLLVTAVSDQQEQPSPLLDLIDPDRPDHLTVMREPLTADAVVARLRRIAAEADPQQARAAAIRLARLARAGVPGADPRHWSAVRQVSDDRPVYAEGVLVPVSPSKLQTYADCPLRWLLTNHGASLPSGRSAQLGTIVHEVASNAPDDTDDVAMRAALDARLAEAGWGTSWSERRDVERAHAMIDHLARYARAARTQGREVVGREVALSAELGGAVLAGRVDRLERDAQGRLLVIDLKTSKTAVSGNAVQVHPQLTAYQVAVELGAFAEQCAGAGGGGAGLLQLGTGSAKAVVQEQSPLAGERLGEAMSSLQEVASGMAGPRFTVRPGTHCRTCPVRSSCPITSEREES